MRNGLQGELIEEINRLISEFSGWRRLSEKELNRHRPNLIAGWDVPGVCADKTRHLRILLDAGFPFTAPRVAVYPSPPILTWPNVEEGGILCVGDIDSGFSAAVVKSAVINLLVEGKSLVDEYESGRGFDRFEHEFISYWDRWGRNTSRFVSLCAPSGPTRWVYSWCSREFNGKSSLSYTLLADTEDAIKSWVRNYTGKRAKDIERTPLAVLEKPLLPTEYPRVVLDLLQHIIDNEGANKIIQEHLLLSATTGQKRILLGFPGRGGFVFAGLLLPPTPDSSIRSRYPTQTPMEKLGNGFRNRMPAEILLWKHFRIPFRGASVHRCDAEWVHGRGHNTDTGVLMQKTVVFVGIGSVGSGVAELVAKMGVGKIVLVDPDDMAPENASRHTLGVRPVAVKKTEDLAIKLRNRFPHLEVEFHPIRWEQLYERSPQVLTSADLVLSTVGEWGAEGALNAESKAIPTFPQLIFGWVENHAAAGHAVLTVNGKGCLNCLVHDDGRMKVPVTEWKGKTTLQIPMCGGAFAPYGAVELSHTQAVIADLAADTLLGKIGRPTHRVWIGQKKVLSSGGGSWNSGWGHIHGDPADGGRLYDLALKADKNCCICGRL